MIYRNTGVVLFLIFFFVIPAAADTDTTAPVITLSGVSPVTVEAGSVYTDAGATASDTIDGDLTLSIITVNPVNTSVVGTYIVTYNVNDRSNNPAIEITRTVNVVDTTAPVITLSGVSPVTVEVGSVYTDAGATASDTIDGDLTSSIITVNSVNTSVVGTYIVTYNVNDRSNNPAIEVTRTINVVDTTAPVITLSGVSPVTVEAGSVYTDAGATASDTIDGDLTSSIITVNPVNTSVVGTYIVTYNVNDRSNNPAIEITRTVNVVDTTAPVITLSGVSPVTVEAGSVYTDAGATASDTIDGDLTSSIITVNSVNTSVVGTYIVTYNVNDSSNNPAIEITRTVNVVDTTAPMWNPVPSDRTIQAGTRFSYDVNATDVSNIVYSIDDGANFHIISVSGLITDKTKLSVGTYNMNITATDAFDNSVSQIITLTVQSEPIYSISGYVFDNNNAGLVNVNIQNGTNQAVSYDTGYYEITGLLNGSYNFSYSKSGFNTDYSIINISGSDVTMANMTLVGIPPTVTSLPPSSGGGSSGGGGGGGGTSGEEFTNILVKEKYDKFIYKDVVTSYKFTNINNPILFINIVGNVNAGEITTAVEVLKNTSSLVKSPAPGNVYQNVNMWIGTSGFGASKNIKQAVIKFRINSSWLSNNNMKSSNIKMVRWDGSKWNLLDTSEKAKDSTYIYFEAKTDGFSSFAITGIENNEYTTENAIIIEPTETVAATATIQPVEKKSDLLAKWFIIIGVFFAIGLIIEVYQRIKKK